MHCIRTFQCEMVSFASQREASPRRAFNGTTCSMLSGVSDTAATARFKSSFWFKPLKAELVGLLIRVADGTEQADPTATHRRPRQRPIGPQNQRNFRASDSAAATGCYIRPLSCVPHRLCRPRRRPQSGWPAIVLSGCASHPKRRVTRVGFPMLWPAWNWPPAQQRLTTGSFWALYRLNTQLTQGGRPGPGARSQLQHSLNKSEAATARRLGIRPPPRHQRGADPESRPARPHRRSGRSSTATAAAAAATAAAAAAAAPNSSSEDEDPSAATAAAAAAAPTPAPAWARDSVRRHHLLLH
jgi:hypothetical protein